MKKKIIMMASAMALTCLSAMAAKPGLEFVFKEGASAKFAFEKAPVITPTTDGVKVTGTDITETTYLFSNIQKIVVIDDATTGISSVNDSSASSLVFDCSGDVVSVSGMKAGGQLTVVSASGQLIGKAVAGSDGTAEVSLGAAAPGIYVVSAQGVSYKISKK